MKKTILIIISIVLMATEAYAELYRITVSRIDQDLYKDDNSGAILENQYCYEYATWENAVLKYEPYSFDNKIIFENGQTCEVKEIR